LTTGDGVFTREDGGYLAGRRLLGCWECWGRCERSVQPRLSAPKQLGDGDLGITLPGVLEGPEGGHHHARRQTPTAIGEASAYMRCRQRLVVWVCGGRRGARLERSRRLLHRDNSTTGQESLTACEPRNRVLPCRPTRYASLLLAPQHAPSLSSLAPPGCLSRSNSTQSSGTASSERAASWIMRRHE
jgi:hypothetical protein